MFRISDCNSSDPLGADHIEKNRPVPIKLEFPLPGTPAHRLFCSEVAEQLSGSLSFKLQIVATLLLLTLVGIGTGITIWGKGVESQLSTQTQKMREEASNRLNAAISNIDTKIEREFETDRIQKTVERVAENQSESLLRNAVTPAISKFDITLTKINGNVDSRFDDFASKISAKEKAAASNLSKLANELKILAERNRITLLADQAIAEGNLAAYMELKKLTNHDPLGSLDSPEHLAAEAEYVRVLGAFSPFIIRTPQVSIIADQIDPTKKDESELTADQLFEVMPKMREFQGRFQVATLLNSKVEVGSFSHARKLAEAIDGETNLFAIRALRAAFQKVTASPEMNDLGKEDVMKWWNENKKRLENSPAKGTPAE